MPLQSRANRTSAPVARPTEPQAGADLNTSPRKRQTVVQAAQETAAPRVDALDEQETADKTIADITDEGDVGNQAEGLERREEVSTSSDAAQQAAEGVAKRTRKPRTVKPKPTLGEDTTWSALLASDDPDELRAGLKAVENTVRDKRKAFEDELKVFRTLYRDLSDKLASTL
jgi:hypothetical protein